MLARLLLRRDAETIQRTKAFHQHVLAFVERPFHHVRDDFGFAFSALLSGSSLLSTGLTRPDQACSTVRCKRRKKSSILATSLTPCCSHISSNSFRRAILSASARPILGVRTSNILAGSVLPSDELRVCDLQLAHHPHEDDAVEVCLRNAFLAEVAENAREVLAPRFVFETIRTTAMRVIHITVKTDHFYLKPCILNFLTDTPHCWRKRALLLAVFANTESIGLIIAQIPVSNDSK